jgi:hypothetical protein
MLTTEKDAVKLEGMALHGIYWLCIDVDVEPLLAHISSSVMIA